MTRAELASQAEHWASAPSGGACDLCGDSTGAACVRVPNDQFKKLVDLGYNPVDSGRADRAMAVSGKGPTEWYMDWKLMVSVDSTDWGLCGSCADDVKRFLAP